MKNEKTSLSVATIAGRVLMNFGKEYADGAPVYAENLNGDLFLIGSKARHLTVAELKAVCASCLTQSTDKKKYGDDLAAKMKKGGKR